MEAMTMTRYISRSGRRLALLLLCLSTFMPFRADNIFGFTDEHPLVIVGDWDFRPFEFINVDGQPAGYNVDVLNLVLDKLDIPRKFVMVEWSMATDMFKNCKADLIHALYYFYSDPPYECTHKYINYYNLKVARRNDAAPLKYIDKLGPGDTLQGKRDDYAPMALAVRGKLPFTIAYRSPKDGLTGISQGRSKYYIWGEIPLRHKIQELGLDNIELDDIDIPAGELRIIGYDKDLIELIDDQYTRLEQAGELQKIYDRWFHPERAHDDSSPVVLLILAGLLVAAVVIFLLIGLVRRRVLSTVSQSKELGQMMSQVLNMGDYYVLEWDLQSNLLRNKYRDLLPKGFMDPQEFLRRMVPDEAQHLHNLNTQLMTGVIDHFDIRLSYNRGTSEQPRWMILYGNAILEKKHGKPVFIVYTAKDITNEVAEERRIRNVASKYKEMFDTNLIAMSFYDVNGVLLDVNNKMRDFCRADNGDDQWFLKGSLFAFPALKGCFLPGTRDVLHACQHLHEPQLGLDKYIEIRVRPVIDDNDELIYYIVTTRDVTADRNMYLEQREQDRRLHATSNAIRRYEQQLGYLLDESQMYLWNYRPAENVIDITRSPGQQGFHESVEDYLQTIRPDYREQALACQRDAMQQGKTYQTILPFDRTPLDDEPTWYSITGVPIFDKDGQLKQYIGLSRNITDLMLAQEKLRVETARAEGSGRQKAAFLANMTHEIRTPLNAIVGFSDLLPMIDSDGERKEFIRIIRNNCEMLLRLINDILEVSDIESRPLAIRPAEVDFAQAFDDICQSLEQRVQTPGVSFIKENPCATLPTCLDIGRIQQVVTNFVINAVKYTKEGHIKVGYRPKDGGLYIYCEDTGAGIPKDKQDTVFERFVKLNEFVQGTGLGLSICKSIAERCGGRIGVESEGEGHGSTFWIWIPCSLPQQKE